MIGFKESMDFSKFTKMNPNDKNWGVLEKMYNKNFLNYEGKKEQKIPKILHMIWLGGELPKKYEVLNQIWKDKNPDWELKIWNDSEIEKLNMANRYLYDNVKNYGAKSDIARYEILSQFGGVYVDTDFYCNKSFNEILYLDFFTGTGHQYDASVINSIVASAPNGEMINQCVNKLKTQKIDESSFDQIMHMTGPYFLTNVIFKSKSKELNVVFPTTFFFPLPPDNLVKMNFNKNIEKYIKPYIKDETFCVHLWYQSWQKVK